MRRRKDRIANAPVLIIGAGPTGMTAALGLSRHGIPVRIVGKMSEPATTWRAIGVQARTLELFIQRGLVQAMLDKGNPAEAGSVRPDAYAAFVGPQSAVAELASYMKEWFRLRRRGKPMTDTEHSLVERWLALSTRTAQIFVCDLQGAPSSWE